MVLEFILDFIFGAIDKVLNLIPAISIPLDMVGSVAGIVELVVVASFFLPMGVIQLCIIIWISVNGTQSIKQAIDWILRKIPTLG